MTQFDFLAAMEIGFAPKKNQEKKEDYLNKLNVFVSKCPENNLQDVYSFAASSEKYPSIKELFKYAREKGYIFEAESKPEVRQTFYYRCNGFYKNIETGKDENGKPVFEKKHFLCDTSYSKEARSCPNCGSTHATIVDTQGAAFPPEVVFVKEDCYRCKIYAPDGKGDGYRVYGPKCSQHGGYRSPDNRDETCGVCACRPCCLDARRSKYEPQHYFYQKNGERADIQQPWISLDAVPGENIRDVKKLSEEKTHRGGF